MNAKVVLALLALVAPYNPIQNTGGVVLSNATGTLAIAHGGTASTTAANARTALSAAASGANSDITSLTALSTPLSVGQGGTGSATQNFVDLTTTQAVAGSKTFSSDLLLSNIYFDLVNGTEMRLRSSPAGAWLTMENGAYGTWQWNGGSSSSHVLTVVTAAGGDNIGPSAGVEWHVSGTTGITAAGTDQATCTQLTSNAVNVTTVAGGTGVCLPPTIAGAHFTVHTSGANSLLIYANPGGGTLNGQSASSGITLANIGGATPGTKTIDCYSSTLCFAGASVADANTP